MTKTKIHNALMTFLLIACIFVGTVFCDWGITVSIAYADADDVQTRYEQTNVMSNLKGSTIGDKEFDVKDYPHNELGKPQVISFVEFCYSYYAGKQTDYGLYVYVYNPQDKAIDTSTDRNKIQLTYGDKQGYNKYTLKFLNYSTDAGMEGRFYKFKILLSASERSDILKTVNPDERVYKISGIELSNKNTVTEYTTAQTYKYKGFAIGYGSELAESDTLSCTVDGFDKYLSLDVRSTYWRPQGTTEDLKSRDTLHSVYFSVPNSIITDYGEMTGVHATWLNAKTAPIIVTGNKTVYSEIEPYIGKYQDAGNSEDYPENKTLNYAIVTDSEDAVLYGRGHYGTTAYNVWTTSYDGSTENCYERIIHELRYLFYADNGNADTYSLPAEMLIGDDNTKGWFEKYTEKHGGVLVNNRYSKDLFDEVDKDFTEVNITANDEFKLSDVTTKDNWWKWLFPHLKPDITDEHTYNISAIQKVTVKDIDNASSKTSFCNEFYVDESDYTDITEYITESAAKNETVYLFRYYQSKYECSEAHEFEFVKDWAIARGTFGNYQEIDSNAYIAQMWVQLDFDIIDLTFTKDNVVTKIPVIMSPMDIAADIDHLVYTTDDNGLAWLEILIAILLGVLVIILLFKLAPSLFVLLGKVIAMPFKAVKSINEKIKPARERNKQLRKERKEQRRLEREQRKQAERKRKEQGKKNKRFWKWHDRENKRKMKIQKKADKQYNKKRQQFKNKDAKKTTSDELDDMSDAELAELFYEEYYDKYGEALPDDDPFDYYPWN